MNCSMHEHRKAALFSLTLTKRVVNRQKSFGSLPLAGLIL